MIEDLGVKVKAASKEAAKLSAARKNNFLLFLAELSFKIQVGSFLRMRETYLKQKSTAFRILCWTV